ncbi:MAG: PAS domain S-box protein [Thainema sp.]
MTIHRRTLLVIADSDEGDRAYRQQLQQDESVAYRILSARVINSALSLSSSQHVDGILLGFHQPCADSVRLLRQLKEQMGDRCPPIVVIDGDDAARAVQVLKNGAADYLVNNRMTPEDLRLAMRSAIENAKLRQQLQHSQEQFQTSVENMLDCFGIFSAIRDDAGQIVDFRIDYLNEAACENNRMTRDMQVGRRLCEVMPVHCRMGLFDDYCQVVETAKPLIKDSLIYEETCDEQQLLRAFDIRVSKLNDGFVASWRDMTERKQLEMELSNTIANLQSQEAAIQQLNRDLINRVAELQSLLDILPVGIAISNDPTCARMHHNAYLRQLLGVPPGNNISKSAPADEQPAFRVLQNGQEMPVDTLPMQRAVKQGMDVRDEEFDIVLPDGTVHQLLSYATPLRDDQDQIRGVVGAFLDITQRNQDAAALKESQQRYRELAEAMPQMIWTADAMGVINYRNQRWYEYTGFSEAESIGVARANAVHPEDRDRALTEWRIAIATGETFETECRFRRWDGEYQWFICRAVPTRDGHNQITGWIGTITNIDDIKRSKALVQRQLAEIEAIYETAPIGLNILDTDLRFVRINQRLADINGLPIEAHLGRSVWELFPDLANTLENLLQPVLATGKPLLNVEIHGELPAQPGVQRTWLEHFFPLKSGNQVIGISTVCEEITERIQVEAALRQSEQRFRNMADNAPAMIWVTDDTGYCTYLNQGWYDFTGQTEETGLGFGWLRVVHPEDSERSKDVFLQANKQHQAFRLEYRLRRRDGTYCWAIDAANPCFSEDGEFKGYIGSVIDISDRKQAEEALRISEERYRTLFENMNEGFCLAEVLFDADNQPIDYRLLETNSVFEKHSGLKDAQGKTARELHPELEQDWIDLYGNVVLTGEPARYENYSEALGRWFDVSAFRIGQPESRKVAILFEDISQRKQTEVALQVSEERYRSLVEATAHIIWNELGDRGEFMSPQPAWSAFTGQTFDELKGWGWLNAVHPDDRAPTTQAWLIALENRALYEFEHRVRRHDGVYRHMAVRAVPVFEDNGAIREWVGVHSDVTDRKQAETALRQSEDRLRMAIESAQLGTWDWNLVTDKLTWDAGCNAMFGLPTEAEISIEVFFEGLHPDDRERLKQVMQWSFNPASGGSCDTEYRTIGIQDGIERWIAAKGQAYFDAEGKPLRFIGTVMDITDQKCAEAKREKLLQLEQAARTEAERANRIKDEFLAVLSHELRSPLNPILGWARLLQMRRFDEAKTAEALATIERNAKLQTQLIDDLLDIAKILRGKLSLNIAPINLSSTVKAAIETVKSSAATKSVSLHSVLPNIGQVSGDAARIQQIVWNLLSNAVKFTPSGGWVEVRLERVSGLGSGRVGEFSSTHPPIHPSTHQPSYPPTHPPAYARITVTDTGKGINPEFLPHIFESFRQEDASITRQYGGLGLGLAIVRELVEVHGGTIHAESPGEGLGATFTVQLPLLNLEPASEPPIELPQTNLDLTGLRVLAVDDDADARELLAASLTQYGAEVRAVVSASEVLANLASFQPDVLVSDIGMPDVDGYQLIQQVRALPPAQGGQTPAIALTAYARNSDRKHAIASGYQRHLTKPLDPERLVQAVAALTRHKLNQFVP